MSRMHRFDRISRQRNFQIKKSPRQDRRLKFEPLEDRRMLAVITVNSPADDLLVDGMVTLREAIQAANTDASVDGSIAGSGADTVAFDSALSGQTITLGGTDLEITEALTIDATALASNVIVDAQQQSRVLNFSALSGDLTLAGLTLTGGRTIGDNVYPARTYGGGAIRFVSDGDLTLTSTTVSGNSTTGDGASGGGIYSFGTVRLISSTVSGNSTTGGSALGGGIYARSGSVRLTSSTVSGNSTAGGGAEGGGIRASSPFSFHTVTLIDSTVSGNSTAGGFAEGGGISTVTSPVILYGSTVSGNSTTGPSTVASGSYGGGIRTFSGDVTLTNSTLSENSTTGDSANGGGIFSTSGNITLNGSAVSGNSTAGDDAEGGGISTRGNVTLTGSTVSGNSTTGALADGGGIYSIGDVMLTDSTVSGNSTVGFDSAGGGIFSRNSVMLTRSTVSGNSTAGGEYAGGGGIYAVGAVTLTSSTISGNSTAGNYAVGGGILSYGSVTLTHSTVTANHADHADASGGGIWNHDDPIIITNSILAGNTATGGMNDIDPGTGGLNVQYSLIQQSGLGIGGGNGNILGMPADLGPLANNGGPTETHALLAGSLAIDAGGTTTLVNDQRGAPFVRVFDDPMVAGAGIDMGAYERQSVAGLNLVVDTAVDENDGDYSAGDLSLREAVGLANGSVGADKITFDSTWLDTAHTILLSLGEIGVSEAVTVDGSGQQLLTIDAQQQSRIFNITAAMGDYTFSGLTVTGGQTLASDESGGAIRSITTGNLTLDRVTISGNSTAGFAAYGGGVYSQGAVTLTNSTVSGNSTADTFARGGGVYSQGAVTLTDSTVSGNSTAGVGADGGGISSQGTQTLTSSTVSGNFTTADSADGGGIFSLLGAVTLTDSTVSGNSTAGNSADGGGIYSKGAVTLMHSTITDNHANHANAFGGGIWNDNDSIVINHTIVAGNTDGGGLDDIRPGTGILTVDFSLIGTGVTPDGGGNNVVSNFPNLGPLVDNGGPTKTRAPLPGSPALDAGDPIISFDADEFDQRGNPFVRVFDDPDAMGTGIDIGAYERQTLPEFSLVVDTNFDENDGDYTAGHLSLREAVVLASGSVGTDIITFDAALTGGTIFLVLGQLEISDSVKLMGLGADVLTIDAQGMSRVLQVIDSAAVDISGLTLTGGNDHRGGAIRNSDGGTVNITASTISGSSATSGGGAIYNTGTLTVTGSTISGNSVVPSRGGGIFNSGMTAVTSSTISGNSATYGGGIWNHNTGTLNVANSTISGNSATSYGGGIYDIGNANVTHSIVAGNMAPNDVDILIGSLDTDTFNLIGGDPLLGPLADNGGPTQTHALLPGSPAIDAGDPTIPFDAAEYDQRGWPWQRVVDGDGAEGARIDVGALELQPNPLPGDYNFNGAVDAADYTVWRDTLGQMGLAPYSGADGNGDGTIGPEDYEVWMSHFGQTLPAPAAGAGAGSLASAASLLEVSGPVAVISTETTAPTFVAGSDSVRALSFAVAAPGSTRRHSGHRSAMRNHTVQPFASVDDQLLVLLASDRVDRAAHPKVSCAKDAGNDDDPNQDPLGLADEPLVAVLAAWPAG